VVVVMVVVVVSATKRERNHVQHLNVDKARARSQFISPGEIKPWLAKTGNTIIIYLHHLSVIPRGAAHRVQAPCASGAAAWRGTRGGSGLALLGSERAGLVLGHLLHVNVNSLFLRETRIVCTSCCINEWSI
jgi:hypothetical protein